ncbi:hypothetical protein DPMN_084096 [Dreissena polymorpha]|uniref:Serine-threonine/tyrosine-protein kinase catalytic domain-containing protein n=1 Tax=Dreissena polymorpha TaxID=45954 RepID=A0A9D3YAG9_DREPO|nr:hypothetical protein DPMN_084096 [Dreissena polymorpha]
MWEATSYGDKPYKGKRGQEILNFLVEEDKRMEKPPLCDEAVYNVMLSCWKYDKNNRPDFKELAVILKSIIGNRRRSLRRPAERLIQDSDEMLERSSIPTT